VIGPILRKVGMSVRREIIVRLVPRTLFLMPTLSIITGTTGWFLAGDAGLLDVPWPQFGWVAAALATRRSSLSSGRFASRALALSTSTRKIQ